MMLRPERAEMSIVVPEVEGMGMEGKVWPSRWEQAPSSVGCGTWVQSVANGVEDMLVR